MRTRLVLLLLALVEAGGEDSDDNFCGGPLFGRHRGLGRVVSRRCAEASSKSCCNEAKRLERLANSWSGRDGRYVGQTLMLGGWICRAVLIFDPELRGTKTLLTDAGRALALDEACGYDGLPPPKVPIVDNYLVVGVHHNGLGNTLYQYAVSRLVAHSTGARYASTLVKDSEGALDTKVPPHSREAWDSFCEIFETDLLLSRKEGITLLPGNGESRAADAECARLVPTRNEYAANGTILFSERPADKRRHRPKETLRDVVAAFTHRKRQHSSNSSSLRTHSSSLGSSVALTCLRMIGYFQDYALLRGVMPLVRSWLPLRPPRRERVPDPRDVVVHVRLCLTDYHHYTYYDVFNYYGPILDRLALEEGGTLRLVTTCSTDKPGVARDLVEKYGAKRVRLDSSASDFLFMTRATTLVICESTFSWWAAALSNATRIHAPGTGAIAPAWDDPRYVFHDVKKLRFWGKFDGREIVYEMQKNRTDGRLSKADPPLLLEERKKLRKQRHHHNRRHQGSTYS